MGVVVPPNVQLRPGELPLGPQPGPQTQFLTSRASITIYGGAAGGGKSFGLLLDAGKYAALHPVPGYNAVIFRRETRQITQGGGLWDESMNVYSLMQGNPTRGLLRWEWPQHRTRINFAHLYEEKDKLAYQGAQIPYIAFDELTHFSEDQFFYLISRNRSTCGVTPRVRATTNPDSESWVRIFLTPWIDPTYPAPATSGEIRWFYRDSSGIVWLKPGEYHKDATSVTFISATVFDNKILLEKDPGYINRLKSLNFVDRQRLLYGDWLIRKAGNKFRRGWFDIVDAPPTEIERTVRFWDLAASEASDSYPDPDWTAGVQVARGKDGYWYVLDARRERFTSMKVENLVKRTADEDSKRTAIYMEQEPGSAGVAVINHYRNRVLPGYEFRPVKHTVNKELRANPVSSLAEGRSIRLVRGWWNDMLLNELEAFPTKGVHDDLVDAFVGAVTQLTVGKTTEDHMSWVRKYAQLQGIALPKSKEEEEAERGEKN